MNKESMLALSRTPSFKVRGLTSAMQVKYA